MATLSNEKRKRVRKRKITFTLVFMTSSFFYVPYISAYLDRLLKNHFDTRVTKINYLESYLSLISNKNQFHLFLIFEALLLLLIIYVMTMNSFKIKPTETKAITDNIEIPVAVGQGQHGSSRFLSEKEIQNVFYTIHYDTRKELLNNGNPGLVLGMTKDNFTEKIQCINDDVSAILIGSSRSGKSRRMIFETIWLRAKAGKSMIITDVKGELFLGTNKYLKDEDYEVIDFDLRQPLKSRKHNYLDRILDALNDQDTPRAIDYTWDLVSVMVGVPKGEPLWTNGESAVIAAAILIVAMEAPLEYKNMTNVYYFLAKMCKSDENGKMLITKYLDLLPDTHPAKGLFDVAEISPEKMRGSFFGMALTTLRLFTNLNIADVTSESDFDISYIGKKKTALFIIVPDEKTTLYPLVSIFINQVYISLVETANKFGGRLPVETDFLCDEFGNFPEIPSFGSMVSAGLGRGIRFVIVIQDYQQLEKKYKDDFGNIKGNCLMTVYLKTTDQKTLEDISKKTGTYTVEVNSVSSSSSGNGKNSNYSNSANMQSRALLLPEEVGRLQKPYSLVLYSGNFPAIMNSPDLSQYKANQILGLGDEEFNRKTFIERDNARLLRKIGPLQLWGIWNTFQNDFDDNSEENTETNASPKRKVSFLDLN